ncbi:MAG: nucleotidyl transferase AbiEii/AbiGii toxin family protein [Deltaproteobacteria bacterium]|nr:nucleotidyl transferase AbiEii/AbiGii toxin family protein [Deltaproteobacteria bacterium]
MGSSTTSHGLTALQREVLREFFRRENGFFLTGGGALVGYHLRHRSTDDLDLFTLDPAAFERARRILPAVAEAVGATFEVRVAAPEFVRAALVTATEALVVDLVRDRVKQVSPVKPVIDGIAVDPPEEILANKLTALVGRQEERDLVDVLRLEQAGHSVESALAAALEKDGGCTPGALAWLLSQIQIPDGAVLPGGVPVAELRRYVTELVRRLRRAAAPG